MLTYLYQAASAAFFIQKIFKLDMQRIKQKIIKTIV